MRPATARTSTSVSSLTWTLKMFLPGSRLVIPQLHHICHVVYTRLDIFVCNQYSLFCFSGRLQPALPDQQSTLHPGNAHQLVPGGKPGLDMSEIYFNMNFEYRCNFNHLIEDTVEKSRRRWKSWITIREAYNLSSGSYLWNMIDWYPFFFCF